MEVIYRSFSIVLIILFCVVVLKFFVLKGLSGWLVKDKNVVADFPYFKKTYFFTPTEKKFFDVLVEAVGDEVVVFSQCRVADLIDVDSKKHFGAFNRIKSKHIDFVLVEKVSAALLCAIELDDKSHARKDRVKRDKFLDQVFAQVELPLFRFRAQNEYSVADIRKGLGVKA